MSMMYLHSASELANAGDVVMSLMTRNGLGPLHEAQNAFSHEVLNGEFSIEFEYPANGDLKPDYGDIVMACPRPNSGYFPFIILDYEKPVDGIIKYYAVHWSVLLSGISVLPFKITESQTIEGGQTVTHDGVRPNDVFQELNGGLHCEPAVQIPLFNNRANQGVASCWPLGVDSGPAGKKDVVAVRETVYIYLGRNSSYRTIGRMHSNQAPTRARLIEQDTIAPYWYKIEIPEGSGAGEQYTEGYVNSDPAYTVLEPAIDPGWQSTGGFLRLVSDIEEYKPFIFESPNSLKALMGDGIEGGSMINVYEGEYIYEPVNFGDKVNYIRFVETRGERKPIVLQYGINMSDFNLKEDFSDMYTDVMPVYVKDDGTAVVGDIISTEKTFPITKVLPVDISSDLGDNDNPTKQEVTEAGQIYFDREKPDEHDITLEIKTDEPSDFQDVDLGDIISVYHDAYNYSADVRCTEYKSDILNDKIVELVFERHVTRDKDVVSRIADSGDKSGKTGGSGGGGSSGGGSELSDATPKAVGTASPGTATRASRSDHVHPATAPTPPTSDDSTKIATTAFVKAAIAGLTPGGSVSPSSTTPAMDGTASVGVENAYARGDHVHPTDTSRAASSHKHGHMYNGGTIEGNDVDPASGDKLVITDSSDSGRIARSSVTFDGSTETKALTPKGTWADIPQASLTTPSMDGTAAIGSSATYAKADHVHPSDTSKQDVLSFDDEPTENSNNPVKSGGILTYVSDIVQQASDDLRELIPEGATTLPLVDGTAAIGVSTKYAKADHVHPSDTTRAPLASPAFTGTPTAPTPPDSDDSQRLATTEFVHTLLSSVVTDPTTWVIFVSPTWNQDGTAGTATLDVTRDDILDAFSAEKHVIFVVDGPDSSPIWMYCRNDNGYDLLYIQSLINYNVYYNAVIENDELSITVAELPVLPPLGSNGQVLTKTANGILWQNIPKQVHLVGMDSIYWNSNRTSATGEVSETRAQILSWLTAGDFVFLNVGSSNDPIWLLPHSDDTGDIYFSSVMCFGSYYDASFSDGFASTQITVTEKTISQVPSGGTTGQVLTKTASGYAWQSLPVYNGGFS